MLEKFMIKKNLHLFFVALFIFFFVLAFPLAWWDWQGRWHAGERTLLYAIRMWLYWAQFSMLPLLLALLTSPWGKKNRRQRSVKTIFCIGLVCGIWAEQIEPHLLQVRYTTIQTGKSAAQPKPQTVKIALVSDIHWGFFGRDWQLQRVIDHIATLDIDAVFIAGDWTYEPKLDLETGFAPLKQLTVPIFGVLGNHDLEKPGPRVADELLKALVANNVQFVEKKTISWKGWQIIGLNDLWGGHPRDEIEPLFHQPASNRLVLTHQPDTFSLLPDNAMQVGLAGHSHGGQVYIPFATEWQLEKSIKLGWYNGLYQTPHGQVFVTPGIGMTNLPFRFAVPPTIDVLTIQVP